MESILTFILFAGVVGFVVFRMKRTSKRLKALEKFVQEHGEVHMVPLVKPTETIQN